MSGNVWEWSQDWWNSTYTGAPTDGSAWMDPTGSDRVARGGSFNFVAAYQRSSKRGYDPPGLRYVYYGARCARDLP